MVSDGNPSVRPMTYYVEKPSDISLLYDSIAYAKAGSVLDMWRHALTNTVFQQGLHNYLVEKYAYHPVDLNSKLIADILGPIPLPMRRTCSMPLR